MYRLGALALVLATMVAGDEIDECLDKEPTGLELSGVPAPCDKLLLLCDAQSFQGQQVRAACPVSCGSCPTPGCKNSAITGMDLEGKPAECPQLAAACYNEDWGADIRKKCPVTCGTCPKLSQLRPESKRPPTPISVEGHSADGAGLELRWSQNKSHVTVDIIVNCTDDYSVEFELDRLHFHCMGHPDTNPGANYSIHPILRSPIDEHNSTCAQITTTKHRAIHCDMEKDGIGNYFDRLFQDDVSPLLRKLEINWELMETDYADGYEREDAHYDEIDMMNSSIIVELLRTPALNTAGKPMPLFLDIYWPFCEHCEKYQHPFAKAAKEHKSDAKFGYADVWEERPLRTPFAVNCTQKCFFTVVVPGRDIVKVVAHDSPKAQTKAFERFIRAEPIKLIKKADKLAPYLKARPDPVIVGYIDKHADPAVAADFVDFLNKTELILRDQYEFVLANSTKLCTKSAKTQDGQKRECPSVSVWHPDGDEIVMNASFTIPEFVEDARLIMKLNYTQLDIKALFDRQNDSYGSIIMWGMDKAGQVDRNNRPPKNLTDLQIPRMVSRRFRHTHPKGIFYAPAGGFSSMVHDFFPQNEEAGGADSDYPWWGITRWSAVVGRWEMFGYDGPSEYLTGSLRTTFLGVSDWVGKINDGTITAVRKSKDLLDEDRPYVPGQMRQVTFNTMPKYWKNVDDKDLLLFVHAGKSYQDKWSYERSLVTFSKLASEMRHIENFEVQWIDSKSNTIFPFDIGGHDPLKNSTVQGIVRLHPREGETEPTFHFFPYAHKVVRQAVLNWLPKVVPRVKENWPKVLKAVKETAAAHNAINDTLKRQKKLWDDALWNVEDQLVTLNGRVTKRIYEAGEPGAAKPVDGWFVTLHHTQWVRSGGAEERNVWMPDREQGMFISSTHQIGKIPEELLLGDQLQAQEVVMCIDLAVRTMVVGEKARFFCPPDMSYTNGNGLVPDDSVTYLDAELVSIRKAVDATVTESEMAKSYEMLIQQEHVNMLLRGPPGYGLGDRP